MTEHTAAQTIESATALLKAGQVAPAREALELSLAAGPWPPGEQVALAVLAGQAACGQGDWEAAAGFYQRAATAASAGSGGAADQARVHLVRARTLGTHPAHRAAALADLEDSLEALAQIRDYPAFVEGLLVATRLWLHEGRWETAVDRATRVSETARLLQRRDVYGTARALAGVALRRLGRWDDAAAALSDGLAGLGWDPNGPEPMPSPAEVEGPLRGPLARALLELAWVRGEQGRVGEAARCSEACVRLAVPGLKPSDNLDVRLVSLLFPATPPGEVSDLVAAVRAVATQAEQRLPAEADAWVHATLALLRLSRPDVRALAATGALREATAEWSRPDLEVKALRAEAALRLALGQGAEAVALLRERLRTTGTGELPAWLAATVRTDLAQALLAGGAISEATALVELSVRALTSAGLDGQLVHAHRLASEGYRVGGRPAEARRHLQAARQGVAALEDDATAAAVALEAGLLAGSEGDVPRALSASAEAVELARASGHEGLLATALTQRTDLLLDAGDTAQATEHLTRIEELGDVALAERTRVHLLRVRARVALLVEAAPAHASALLHEALTLARAAGLAADEAQLIALLEGLSEDRV